MVIYVRHILNGILIGVHRIRVTSLTLRFVFMWFVFLDLYFCYISINSSWKSFSIIEAVAQRCSIKKVFLEVSQNSQKNTCARVSFLIKLLASAYNFIKKETPAQVFSCEFGEIFKNTSFYRTLPVAASSNIWISS